MSLFRPSEKWGLVKDKIDKLYEDVKKSSSPFLQSQDATPLSLQVEHMGDASDSRGPYFFSPLSEEELKGFPLIDNSDNSFRTECFKAKLKRECSMSLINEADGIFLSLTWLVKGAERHCIPKSEHGFSRSLGILKGWKFQEGFLEGVIDPCYADHLLNNCYMHGGYGTRPKDATVKPHIMLSMKHNVAGDERLLKGDVLAILAALKSRMEWAKLQKHRVIPVMLFSFMGHHAKIIEAYHDGEKLIVRQSRLFEFDSYETAPIDLFVRYMTSKAVGNTREFPRHKPVETQQTRDTSKRDTWKNTFRGMSKRLPIPDYTKAKDKEEKEKDPKEEKLKEKGPKGKERAHEDSKKENGDSKKENDDSKKENGDSNGKTGGSSKE